MVKKLNKYRGGFPSGICLFSQFPKGSWALRKGYRQHGEPFLVVGQDVDLWYDENVSKLSYVYEMSKGIII